MKISRIKIQRRRLSHFTNINQSITVEGRFKKNKKKEIETKVRESRRRRSLVWVPLTAKCVRLGLEVDGCNLLITTVMTNVS